MRMMSIHRPGLGVLLRYRFVRRVPIAKSKKRRKAMEEMTYHRALNCDSLGTWGALLATRTCWSHFSRWAWFTLKQKI